MAKIITTTSADGATMEIRAKYDKDLTHQMRKAKGKWDAQKKVWTIKTEGNEIVLRNLKLMGAEEGTPEKIAAKKAIEKQEKMEQEASYATYREAEYTNNWLEQAKEISKEMFKANEKELKEIVKKAKIGDRKKLEEINAYGPRKIKIQNKKGTSISGEGWIMRNTIDEKKETIKFELKVENAHKKNSCMGEMSVIYDLKEEDTKGEVEEKKEKEKKESKPKKKKDIKQKEEEAQASALIEAMSTLIKKELKNEEKQESKIKATSRATAKYNEKNGLISKSFKMQKSLADSFKIACESRGEKMSEVIAGLLEAYIAQNNNDSV